MARCLVQSCLGACQARGCVYATQGIHHLAVRVSRAWSSAPLLHLGWPETLSPGTLGSGCRCPGR
eukprot:3437182-Lingulodinium_polyedra.AAC.1